MPARARHVNLRPFADGLVIAGFKSCSGARVRCNGGAKESPKWGRRVIGGKAGDPDHAGPKPLPAGPGTVPFKRKKQSTLMRESQCERQLPRPRKNGESAWLFAAD